MNPMELAGTIANEITQWRRELHQIPECGLLLPQTANYVQSKLQGWGIPYHTYQRHSGILAVLGKPGSKTIAIRADMDGLRLKEETGLPYASKNDNMHACGHDAHTAILLGVAKLLKEQEHLLNGQVKLIFQPAEEGPGGAPYMIKDGVLDGVDAMLALHCSRDPDHKPGDIAVRYGNMNAADDQAYLTIYGQGGHGASPHQCVDPVAISALVLTALQQIVSREIKPSTPAVITFATVQIGRGAENIIADSAFLKGTVRTPNYEVREFVLTRIREVVEGITAAMRGRCELEFKDGYPPLINDDKMVDRFLASASKLMPQENIHILPEGSMGGEDCAFFFEKVPGCFFRLEVAAPHTDGVVYPGHNSKFCIDDSLLYKGTGLFIQAVLDYLNDTNL